MRLHRFMGDYDFTKGTVEIKDGEVVNQIKNVLRMTHGGRILLSDGQGSEAEVVISEMMPKAIFVDVLNVNKSEISKKEVSLFLAILKKENFEIAVQKAVECGVSNIIPFINERTVKTGLNMERLQKIVREASEQCGRNTLPKICEVIEFEKALELGGNSEEKIVFHLTEKEYTPDKKATTSSIFIGPEGGFTENEISLAKEKGYTISSLGHLTLRAETATIVATYRAVNNT